jgi:hypothetical protein
MNKILFPLLLLLAGISFGQSGKISGNCIERSTGEPIPFAKIQLVDHSGSIMLGETTDIDGNFTFPKVAPGVYSVRAEWFEYNLKTIYGITVVADKTTFVRVELDDRELHLD